VKTQAKSHRPSQAERPKKPRKVRRAAKIMTEARFEKLVGSCAHLWKSDDEFNAFVSGIYERRHKDI
jgi:hypothetical protein